MRALVVVHAKDLPRVENIILNEGELSSNIFTSDNCSFELCHFTEENGRRLLTRRDGGEISHDEIARRFSVIILVAADHAASEQGLTDLVSTFLWDMQTPDWANEAAVIICMADMSHSPLQSLASERVFRTSSQPIGNHYQELGSAAWIRQVKSEFDGFIRTIEENQTRNPNVGFGVLLIDNKFNFFLMERLREPGRGTLGTIGGNFERTHDTNGQLASLLQRRFRRNGGPQMDLGPLLACTNMRGAFLHYIDLTFLAVAPESTISDVSDEQLRPPGQDMLRCLNGRAPKGKPRVMFTLREVAIFHRKGHLFTPVANAFECLCRNLLAEHLLHGRRKIVKVPSLLDESKMLEINLGPNSNDLRKIVSSMPWSKTAIPFFECEI